MYVNGAVSYFNWLKPLQMGGEHRREDSIEDWTRSIGVNTDAQCVFKSDDDGCIYILQNDGNLVYIYGWKDIGSFMYLLHLVASTRMRYCIKSVP